MMKIQAGEFELFLIQGGRRAAAFKIPGLMEFGWTINQGYIGGAEPVTSLGRLVGVAFYWDKAPVPPPFERLPERHPFGKGTWEDNPTRRAWLRLPAASQEEARRIFDRSTNDYAHELDAPRCVCRKPYSAAPGWRCPAEDRHAEARPAIRRHPPLPGQALGAVVLDDVAPDFEFSDPGVAVEVL